MTPQTVRLDPIRRGHYGQTRSPSCNLYLIQCTRCPDYLNWKWDPRLVPGGIGIWHVGYHRPSGVSILQFCLQGRWKSSAFQAFMESLRVFLPGRYNNYTVDHGVLRVTVYLFSAKEGDTGWRQDEDYGLMPVVIGRVYAIIARMVAATRGLPLPAPLEDSALPPLSPERRALFRWAVGEQIQSEYTKFSDSADFNFYDATWIKLRHRFSGIYEPGSFRFKCVVTPSELLKFVQDHETKYDNI
jgi:hypothetical protein